MLSLENEATKTTILLWNDDFHVKTGQSAENQLDLAKNENRPEK